jgi:hypothetical protein
METSPKETRPVTVRGRDIQVRQLTDAQLLLLSRDGRLAQREDADRGLRMAAVGRLFDVLESLVQSPEDKQFLLDLVVQGELELSDLTPFLTAFREEIEAKAPKVRSGRRTPSKRAS